MSQHNPCLVCNVVKARDEDFKSFLSFFDLVQEPVPKGFFDWGWLNQHQASWRQWAGFGLIQHLWFALGLCGLWSAEKSHLF